MKNTIYFCTIVTLLLTTTGLPAFSQSKQSCEGENHLQTADGRCIDFSSLTNQTGGATNSNQASSSSGYIPASQKFRDPAFGPIVEPDARKICKYTLKNLYPSYSSCVANEEAAKKLLEDNEDNFLSGDIQQCYSEGHNLSKPVISYVQKLSCVTNRISRRNYLKN